MNYNVSVFDRTGDSQFSFGDVGEAVAFVKDQLSGGNRWAYAGGQVMPSADSVTVERLEGVTDIQVADAVVGG